jgi:DNA-binding CsgD family transcriptional regulator
MNAKVVIFTILFILTTGLGTFGILASLSLRKNYRESLIQSLIYQQIFVYSFLIYAIWGNILISELVKTAGLNSDLFPVISFFIPFLGMPFLILNWYMLLKFLVNLTGKSVSNVFTAIYFCFFTILLLSTTFVIRSGEIDLSKSPELLVSRSLLLLNGSVHLILFIFLILWKFSPNNAVIKRSLILRFSLFVAGSIGFSAGFWFIYEIPFIFQALIILLIFVIYASFPIIFYFQVNNSTEITTEDGKQRFRTFYENFDISKRESEIITEIISGKSNQEIADKLFITLQTVKDHVHRIYTKTGIKNRVQLINLTNSYALKNTGISKTENEN